MVDGNVGGLSPLRGPLATGAAGRKYTDVAARVARVLLEAVLWLRKIAFRPEVAENASGATDLADTLRPHMRWAGKITWDGAWKCLIARAGLDEVIEGEQLAPINDLM
jgi:hypothetical protein